MSTVRTETDEEITFTTDEMLRIMPCHLRALASIDPNGEPHSHRGKLDAGSRITCFVGRPEPGDEQLVGRPEPGDAFLIGLSNPVPSCTVVLHLDCRIEGVGVDPKNPPLVWEAWTGTDWTECEVERDGTSALNEEGDIVLHVPPKHASSSVGDEHAAWLRCRLLAPKEGQPFYSASPEIAKVAAYTIGGTVGASHATIVQNERIGVSEGVPGQRFLLDRRPVVPGAAVARARGLHPTRMGRLDRGDELRQFGQRFPPLHARPGRGRGRPRPGGPRRQTEPCATTAPSRRRGRRCECGSIAPAAGRTATFRKGH